MKRRLISLAVIVCVFCGYSFAQPQSRSLTQKDLNIFFAVQPAFQKLIKKAVDESKNTHGTECAACKGAHSSPYRKEVEAMVQPYHITAEDYGFIHSRVISLYALLQSEEIMREAAASLERENAEMPAELKSELGTSMKEASQKKNNSLAAYTKEETALIRKHKPQLDALFSDLSKDLFNQPAQ